MAPSLYFLVEVIKINTLESCTVSNPFNKDGACAKFIIDTPEDQFVLDGVSNSGQQYTFGLWIKSDEPGSFTVKNETFVTSTEWMRCVVHFIASGDSLGLNFDVSGTYYIYHPKLEIGNKDTDWSPAPEDVDESILEGDDSVRQEIVTQSTQIIEDCEAIILSAIKSKVETSEFEALRETIETQFAVMAGEISATFTRMTERDDDLESELEEMEEAYSKKIGLSENGIIITDSDGVYSVQVDNTSGVTIRKNGEIRSQLVDDDFYTGNMVIEVNERAQFGKFAFIPRSDGSLSFLKVGG